MSLKNQKIILVVDDEPDLLELISMDLEMSGYSVLTANSGHSAMEIIKNNQIDLVVSDQNMPNGTGMELLQFTKSLSVDLPFIIFITCGTSIKESRAYAQGCEGILDKPFEFEELLSLIQRYLAPPKQRWLESSKYTTTAEPFSLTYKSLDNALAEHQLSIGRGGLTISHQELPPQARNNSIINLQIKFEDNNTPPLQTKAKLLWVEKNPYLQWGLEFLELSPQSFEWMSSYLDSKKPLPYIPPTSTGH